MIEIVFYIVRPNSILNEAYWKNNKNYPVQKFEVKKEILSQFFSFLAYDFIKYMHSVSFCQKINIEWNRVIHSSYSLKNDLKNTFLKYLLKFMRKLFYQHSIFHFVFLTYIKSSFIFLGSYSLIFTYFCYLPLFCTMWSFNHNNQVLM